VQSVGRGWQSSRIFLMITRGGGGGVGEEEEEGGGGCGVWGGEGGRDSIS
jgi:hypothetical protein